MHAALLDPAKSEPKVRPAGADDLEPLLALEHDVFHTDRLSRRSLRRFLASPHAETLVAEHDGRLAGYALVLFRPKSAVARLYSIAISPHSGRRGLGRLLLAAAEQAALDRHCTSLRLEVHERNDRAIALYQKAGYRVFGRHQEYYGDRGNALRFEKRLHAALTGAHAPPPYFHQTTEFTCGAACIMMALGWADPSFRASPALEYTLWREATTIFMTGGPGGCEPYGLAVTLQRHGLSPELFVSRPGPYFVDTVRAEDRRRVMLVAQAEFQRKAGELRIPCHLFPLGESALMDAFDNGAVAIVLVAGYHGGRRKVPHWVFAFGHGGRSILLHDPGALRDDQGNALAAATYAMPTSVFHRWSQAGSDKLQATILIRKGPAQ
jgi:ribosomal protein S18 acetylase RimI-like enzyme